MIETGKRVIKRGARAGGKRHRTFGLEKGRRLRWIGAGTEADRGGFIRSSARCINVATVIDGISVYRINNISTSLPQGIGMYIITV